MSIGVHRCDLVTKMCSKPAQIQLFFHLHGHPRFSRRSSIDDIMGNGYLSSILRPLNIHADVPYTKITPFL